MMKWTESQSKAISIPVTDVIVSAAAGSGKTAVMAERIIRRLTCENYVDIDKILVVTYTNAAASEIKERVMKTIVNKMSEGNSEILQKQLILIDNSHFCTIHSFCLEIIKKHFYMLGLDPQVKTGDPADVKVLLEQAATNVFDEYFANGDNEFTNLVNSYGNSKENEFKKIILDVYNFSRTMPDSNKWLDSLPGMYEGKNGAVYSCILDYAFVTLSFVKDELSTAINLIKKSNCCIEWLGTIESELSLTEDLLNSKDDFEKVIELVSKFSFSRLPTARGASDLKLKNRIKSLRDSAKKEILDAIEKIMFLSDDSKSDNKSAVVSVVKKIKEIVKRLSEEYDLLKRKKNIIDFADYEHLALKLLRNPDGTPTDVAKSISEGFEEIYIDEYQDCNNIQNEIFKYISGAIYGRPNLFCVGDMKQSIYKFRDANPLNFKYKCDNSVNYDGDKVNLSNKIFLNANFRSRKSILDFVNAIFGQLMSEKCGELDYTQEESLVYGAEYKDVNKEINSIELDIINESDDFGDGDYPQYKGNDFSKQEAEVMHIASKIKNMVESGYLLYNSKDKVTRKASYGDFAVLFRSPADYTASIEKIFGDMKIPHTCDVSGNFYDTAEVGFLVALLRIIDNPDDDISLVTVLKNPVFGFDENMLLKIKLVSHKKSFYQSIKDYVNSCSDNIAKKLSEFIIKLDIYHKKSKYTELGDFILYLIDDLKYFAYISSFTDSDIKKNNVRIFISKAVDFEKDSFKGIYRFIKYIDNIKQNKSDLSAKAVAESDDLVRVMSIHKSKGLEFPVVFLAGTGKKYNTMDTTGKVILHKDLGIGIDSVYYDKSYKIPTLNKHAIKQKIKYETMSEELRVLYVAVTRPTEKLIITGTVKNGTSFINSIQNILHSQSLKINPYLIAKSKCFLETILLSTIRSEKFEDALIVQKDGLIISDGIEYNVNLINKSAIDVAKTTNIKCDWKSEFDAVTGEYDNLVSLYNSSYPFSSSYGIPGNLSVTEIKKIKNSDSDDVYLYTDHALQKPASFMNDKPISGNIMGTLIHLCMEKLDFSRIKTAEDVIGELDNLVKCGVITPEERKAVDHDKIIKFLSSDIGKKILARSHLVQREFSFKYLEDAKEVFGIDSNEKIVIQGTIDLFFEDDDGSIVLVDYKTDKIKDGNVDKVIKSYSVQLECYSRALQSIFGKKVKEKIIYLFDADKKVSL